MNRTTHELSYSELRSKMVVDLNDGKNLGHISDMVFSPDLRRVMGIIAPLGKRGMFAKGQDVFIPISCIKNIGEDVIIEISQIGKVCHTRCAIYYLAGDCIFPREGIFGVALQGGTVKPGDTLEVLKVGDGAASAADLSAATEDPGCDHRCDKCMLFDCRFRWKGKAF